jgi:cell filamentation protein
MVDRLSKEELRRQTIEATLTSVRIVELLNEPVKGAFDAAHLREVNRRIFQDLPAAGFTQVAPGQYRPPVPSGQHWIKPRGLEAATGTFVVAYSAMDEKAQLKLEAVLKEAKPELLKQLPTDEFTKKIADIYAQCDYAHPFLDGNSRTLRSFTAQLAKESGYKIDWESFSHTPSGRDTLYIARDRSVNAIAFPQLQSERVMRDVNLSMYQLKENKNLSELLQGKIEPLRSVAFKE